MPDSGDYHGYRGGTSGWASRDEDERLDTLEEGGGSADPEAPAWSDWITLTNADIKALKDGPFTLEAAPGAGKRFVVHHAIADVDVQGGAYAGIDAGAVLYIAVEGSTGDHLSTLVTPANLAAMLADTSDVWTNDLLPAHVKSDAGYLDTQQYTAASLNYAYRSDFVNKGLTLVLSGQSSTITGGHAANTLKIRVLRSVLSLP